MNKKILMVCIGNICRSPIAEGVLQTLADAQSLPWQVDSAAVMPYHIGSPPHKDSIRVCQQHGIDISGQRAMLFEPEHLQEYDEIYVMAEDVMSEIRSQVSEAEPLMSRVHYFMRIDPSTSELDLLDPWYGGYEGYELVYEEISRRCKMLVDQAVGEAS